jgi:hypothetical protein
VLHLTTHVLFQWAGKDLPGLLRVATGAKLLLGSGYCWESGNRALILADTLLGAQGAREIGVQ